MATIKDIARLAGVGTSTVSRALNGGRKVGRKALERIEHAAHTLGYRPNTAARDLVRGGFTQNTVGVVLPLISHPFFQEIVRGITDVLNSAGRNILLFSTSRNREEVMDHVLRQGLAGLILVSQGLSETERNLMKLNRCVAVLSDYHQEGLESFYIDHTAGGRLAAEYLAGKECARIAYIGESLETQQQSERYTSFIKALETMGLSVCFEERVEISDREAMRATSRAVTSFQADGIFYFCDRLAAGGLNALSGMRHKVSVIGYDDMPASAYLGLTTIRQPAYRMGRESAERLLELVRDRDGLAVPSGHLLIPELVVRAT